MSNAPRRAGRIFLPDPGADARCPTESCGPVDLPVIDHRGPEFKALGLKVLAGIKTVFKTSSPVFIYPSSGTGAWEAALLNTLSPGDKVLMYETGHFATLWRNMSRSSALQPEFIASDWRSGADAGAIEARLREDKGHTIKAVCVGAQRDLDGGHLAHRRGARAIDAGQGTRRCSWSDTISSLASIDYRHDEWGVDVTVGGSQKGLMLPPGLGFNAVSDKAMAATKSSKLPKSYFSWEDMLPANKEGFFPYTPATNLLYGLAEAIDMLHEEGLDRVFARHDRHAEGVRRATRAWGLEIWCKDPKYYSSSLTAILLPAGHNADAFRKTALEHFDVSLAPASPSSPAKSSASAISATPTT
jgi:alanine-glyoxylate transaminase/serine-glyoxylate transaminase/serine-pyruvate transaminase